jgi:hypothetical protein
MTSTISLAVSVLALAISGLTAWLTLMRKGTVLMTQPTVIYFGPDGGPNSEGPRWKIYLRALLYATSKRGCIIESMYVRLRRGETSQNFNIWIYGNKNELVRGSGLFVPETGVAANHHFILPPDGTSFQFLSGHYTLEVFVSLVGEPASRLLYSVQLDVSAQQAHALKEDDQGLYFDWGPDAATYHPHLQAKPKPEFPDFLGDLLR